jgi:hypothetical protein
MEFWIIFTVAATSPTSLPSDSPAATTAPVASIVPPIQAPPTSGSSPSARIAGGIATIMMTVKKSERPIASDSSSFFARHAAPVAIAADTPHTDMSAASVMQSGRDGMRSACTPNR